MFELNTQEMGNDVKAMLQGGLFEARRPQSCVQLFSGLELNRKKQKQKNLPSSLLGYLV